MSEEQQTWLWVVGPAYYLDDQGQERSDLEPGDGTTHEGWWTCHRDTRFGDLALIYRTTPRKDIAYLARAESDAYPIDNSPSSSGFACDYVILAKLDPPYPLSALKADPDLADWGPLKANLIGAAHRIPPELWQHLISQLPIEPAALSHLVSRRALEYLDEAQIQQHFENDKKLIRKAGLQLRFVESQRHYRAGGIADLVYRAASGRTVVVELKAVPVGKGAIRQLLEYLGSESAESRKPLRPHGILIGPSIRAEAKFAIDSIPHVRFIPLRQFGIQPAGVAAVEAPPVAEPEARREVKADRRRRVKAARRGARTFLEE